MKVPNPVVPAVVAAMERGFAAFPMPTVCVVTVKTHAVVGTVVHGIGPAVRADAATPAGPEMVMPRVSTPEVTSKTVSSVAVLKNPMKVAVPKARTCCPGGIVPPVMYMPGVIAVVTAVTTSVFGAKALIRAVTEPELVAILELGRMVPAGDTPGGQ